MHQFGFDSGLRCMSVLLMLAYLYIGVSGSPAPPLPNPGRPPSENTQLLSWGSDGHLQDVDSLAGPQEEHLADLPGYTQALRHGLELQRLSRGRLSAYSKFVAGRRSIKQMTDSGWRVTGWADCDLPAWVAEAFGALPSASPAASSPGATGTEVPDCVQAEWR
jgi:hypothetical protein